MLIANQAYSRRVDGFELAYKAIRKQLPPPGQALPTNEFYALLDKLETDFVPPLPVQEKKAETS